MQGLFFYRFKIINGASKTTLLRSTTQFAQTCASAVGIFAFIYLCAPKNAKREAEPPKSLKNRVAE